MDSRTSKYLKENCRVHLEFYGVLWEVLVGHEGRVLAAPLEQRREPGLVLQPALIHLLRMGERKKMSQT